MIGAWSVYEVATGYIRRILTGPESILALNVVVGTEGYIPGEYDPREFYVLDGQAVTRLDTGYSLDTTSVPADGVTPATFTGLANPTQVDVADPHQTFEVTDGTLELTFNSPGTYGVTLTGPFPAKPITVEIVAA